MAKVSQSRFALLKIEDDDDENDAKTKLVGNKNNNQQNAAKKKNKKKKKPEQEENDEVHLFIFMFELNFDKFKSHKIYSLPSLHVQSFSQSQCVLLSLQNTK